MSITNEAELAGMKKASEAVAHTLKEMTAYAQPGMTTKQLDDYGADILASFGGRSAPKLAYGFPGCTCISSYVRRLNWRISSTPLARSKKRM